MVAFLAVGAIVAYIAYDEPKLVNLAIISYQGVVQLAVPLFGGLFWRRGTREGAIVGMIVGFVLAMILTAMYPDNIPGLGGLTAGIPALAVNLLIFLGLSFLRPQSAEERARVDALFLKGERSLRHIPATAPSGVL
jgi:SSS family solute:Na+ symporter